MPRPDEPKRWRRSETRDVTATNKATGELIELGDLTGYVPAVSKRKQRRREIKFVMVAISMDAMPKLRMASSEWSLFWTLVSYIDLERGEARVQTNELAVALGRLPADVSRSLGKLRKRRILIRETQGVWRVNPLLLARGQAADWEIEMRDAPEIDWEGKPE